MDNCGEFNLTEEILEKTFSGFEALEPEMILPFRFFISPSCILAFIGIADRIHGNKMLINFERRKCGAPFDCDVGTITLSESSDRPNFKKQIIYPKCGELSMDEEEEKEARRMGF